MLQNYCTKASTIKKTQPLSRDFSYVLVTQRKLLMNAYFLSQF